MIKRIPYKVAVSAIVSLQVLVIAFHLTVITGFVPYTIVWGGRLSNVEDMIVFESASILINLLLLGCTALKTRRIKQGASVKILNGFIWAFALLFALNTIGNLFAKASLETIIFTPLTFILAVLCGRVAMEK